MVPLSYVLPFRSQCIPSDEFIDYINELAALAEVLLIDASPGPVFDAVDARRHIAIRHVVPDTDLAALANGKVRGVLTGLRLSSYETVIIADDDVRYSRKSLEAVVCALDAADLVRPQNYFDPLPWHARLDSARTLINRMTGGDWPGTLAVRRSVLAPCGYDGNVLFENLELVRTVEAAGGRVVSMPHLFVRRLPPRTHHFWTQRIRQAYDEFARPARLIASLAVLPAVLILIAIGWTVTAVLTLCVLSIVVAELGRRRARGRQVFPVSVVFWAPLWVTERAMCSWLAVCSRLLFGGVRYHGRTVRCAAHSVQELQRRRFKAT